MVTAPAPEQAGRDPQAERDYAEFTGWWEAQGYDADHAQTFYGADVMAETFLAGMQAQRDLDAAQEPGPAPDARRALLDIVAELDRLDEPGPAADYIRMLAEYGLGEAPHPDGGGAEDGG